MSYFPCPPTPMKPIVMRLLGAGRSSAPRAEIGMIVGPAAASAVAPAAAFRKRLRVGRFFTAALLRFDADNLTAVAAPRYRKRDVTSCGRHRRRHRHPWW